MRERVAGAAEGELIGVSVRLTKPPHSTRRPGLNLTRKEMDEFRKKEDELLAAHIEGVVTPVADRLASLGYELRTGKYSAVIYAELTPATIKEVEGWPEVSSVEMVGISKPSG